MDKAKSHINFVSIFSFILFLLFNVFFWYFFAVNLSNFSYFQSVFIFIIRKLININFLILCPNHKKIKDVNMLLRILFFGLLIPISFQYLFLDYYITVMGKDSRIITSSLTWTNNGDCKVQDAYYKYLHGPTSLYYDYANQGYIEYLFQINSGNGSVNEYFANVIEKLRTEEAPNTVITFRDIYAIKYMGSNYGYDPGMKYIFRSLGNGDLFGHKNRPIHGWANRFGGQPVFVLNELSRVQNGITPQQEMREAFNRQRKKLELNQIYYTSIYI